MKRKPSPMRAALLAADQALTDWVRQYARSECSEKHVAESTRRVWLAGGTLYYVAKVRAQIKLALKGKK